MKTNVRTIDVLKAGAAALLLAGVVGCAAPAYDVSVYLSPQLKDAYRIYPSVEVDVIGVDAAGSDRFASTTVDDYFSPGGALRRSMAHMTMRFSEDDLMPKRLAPGDEVWGKFAEIDADRLVVMVNLPPYEDRNAAKPASDGRRLEIPLEKDSCLNPRRWFGWPSRTFEIQPVGVTARAEAPSDAREPVTVRSAYEK